MAIVVIQSIFC